MKKKLLVLLSAIAVIAVSAAVFSACSRGEGHEHALTEHKALEATCTEAGNIAYWECEECGKIFSDAEGNSELAPLDTVILPSGHTLGNWIVDEEPTCAQEGSRHKDCTSCGAVLERGAISKTDHVLVIDRGIEPTCTSMGKTEGIHCSACNKVLLAQKSIPKLDHTPGEWIVDSEPTCAREGSRHTECEECGSVLKIVTLEKLPHSFVDRVCENCGALDYSEGLEYYLKDDGTYMLKSIGNCVDNVIIVPEVYNEKPVTEIFTHAFYGCENITSIILPDSIIEIGDSAFYKCTKLSKIILPNSLQSIGQSVFSYCGIESIDIPVSVKEIGDWSFSHCNKLVNIVLPESLSKIGKSMFSGCSSLQSVEIPDSVEVISRSAFFECINLKSIDIPNGVQKIDTSVFYGCTGLEKVSLPNTVRQIGISAFQSCTKLVSIELPSSLESISSYAFAYCTGLKIVNIPKAVEYIEAEAFVACYNLQSVEFGESQGWQYTSAPAGAEMIAISETMLSDPAAAAKCLWSDYVSYYWIKG